MFFRRLCLCCLLASAAAGAALAETRDYYFQRIADERGLTQNTVNAIVQDRQGFVWVGTRGGLHRYDGQRYRLYRNDPRDPGSLPDSHITALALDGEQGLWVGSYSQYLSRLDLHDGRVRRYAVPEGTRSGDPRRLVSALWAQPGGDLWIGTPAGLERMDVRTGKRSKILALSSPASEGGTRQALVSGGDGRLWFGTAQGLYLIDAKGHAQRIGPAVRTYALHRDAGGRVWVGNAEGLHLVDLTRSGLVRRWPEPGAPPQSVDSIAASDDGHLWFAATGDGLRRIAAVGGEANVLREMPSIPGGLPENTINVLMKDDSGLLWVGGQKTGIAVTDPHGVRFSYLYDDARLQASDFSVRAMAQDASDSVWIATDLGHLLRYSPGDRRLDDLGEPFAGTPVTEEPAPRINGFANADAGGLWLATGLGLQRLDTATGRIIPMALAGGVPYPDVLAITSDASGTLWLGTRRDGLLRYEPGRRALRRYAYLNGDPTGISDNTVHAVLVDRRGRVWIGTGDGLDLLEGERLHHFQHVGERANSLPGNVVRSLAQTSDGRLWAGTQAGLAEIVETGAGFQFMDALRANDFPVVPIVFSIQEDHLRRLWLGTDAGLVRFDPSRHASRRYGLADGLQDLEFNGGASLRLHDGRLAFGGIRGINLFDPARIRESSFAPPVRLLSLRMGDKAPANGGVAWGRDRLTMAQEDGILQLQLGALDFADPSAIRYRYRLVGYDDRWIENGSDANITYTGLPPGNYRLHAQASNRDGIWSARELQLPILVTAPAWRSKPALASYGFLALAAFLALAWRWRRQRRAERGYFQQIREREERLKIALWGSGEHFWDSDLITNQAHVLSVEEIPNAGQAIRSRRYADPELKVHPEDLPLVQERMQAHIDGRMPMFLSEHRVSDAEGKWTWMRARGRIVERDAEGRVTRVAGTVRDISGRRDADRERRIASEVLRSMSEAVSVLDENFIFVAVNPAFTKTTGYTEAEAIGRSASMLDSRQHDHEFYMDMRAALVRDGQWAGEMWQRRKTGEEILCSIESTAVEGAIDQRNLYVAVISDITRAKRTEHELRMLANYDTLTNLPNRSMLSERLSQAIVSARREDTRIAVLFLDLDRFKDINDSLGHATGDRILRASAARLREVAPQGATVARLSGDEFTVVLEHVKDPAEGDRLAEKIIHAFDAPLMIEDRREIIISPSIGISLYPDHAQVPTDLLKHADTAMYQAKAAGRRTYQRYTEQMEWEIRQRATLTGALRKVLENGELRLVYQPKLSLGTGKITGVEALLRWEHPYLGDIPPSHFIPLAEESGMILPIGEWVLREACTTLKRWRQHGLDTLSMSVNVSALQLLRGDLPQQVQRVLTDTGVPADFLELELTESVVMTKVAQTAAPLQALRDIGVRLAIDDFGTGYSSLAYLKRLPITTLKIDKAFIDDIGQDEDDEAITSSIIAMARTLELNVVAEGVEHRAQAQLLLAQHCDEIQGYWVSRPLDPYRCLAFLRNWPSGHEPLDPAPGPA